MTKQERTLAVHLEHLAADAAAVSSLLHVKHQSGGDIHPEALAKSARLEASLRDVINALLHHEHLAMDADDVWHALSVKHGEREINPPD